MAGTLERAEHVNSPGGWQRDLTARAREGAWSRRG
ncbi:hypothetical protein [Sinorhizobium meliloti]